MQCLGILHIIITVVIELVKKRIITHIFYNEYQKGKKPFNIQVENY